MSGYSDELGITYTASDATSVAQFNNVIGAYLGSSKAVMPMLDGIIEHDSDMLMAQCLRAYMLKLAADPRFETPFRLIATGLATHAGAANERERRHIAALDAWARGNLPETTRRLESILSDYPRDMVALRVAHYLHFYAGTPEKMRDSVAQSVAAWDETAPFYGYLLGMYAFGLEESGDYENAEKTGKRAIEYDPADIWAAHAVQHVFQMTARYKDGIAWMKELIPGFEDANNFVYHMHWHKALCHIGEGDYAATLDIYDTYLDPAIEDDFYLDVCNAASLLWRLELLGVNVGDRWSRVAETSSRRVADRELLFSTLHYLMTPARLGDREAVKRGLDSIEQWSRESSTQGALCQTVGLPLARAIVDLSAGEHAAAVATLDRIADEVYLIGGSHAQRDLFTQFHNYAKQAAS